MFKPRDKELVEFEDFLKKVGNFDYPLLSESSKNSAHQLAVLGLVGEASDVKDFFKNTINIQDGLKLKDSNQATALHVAAFFSHNKVTAETTFPLLLTEAEKIKFDFNAPDNAGRTILHLLASVKSPDKLIDKYLNVAKDANLEAQDKYGATPLQTALFEKNFNAARELVEHGASLDNKGGLLYSPREYLEHAIHYTEKLATTASNDHDKQRWSNSAEVARERLAELTQSLDLVLKG